MTLRFRRFLYIIFILIFLVVTPQLWLYAAGYKLSFSDIWRGDFSYKKTGMIIIDSEPKGAEVFLDGNPVKPWLGDLLPAGETAKTPAKIKNLYPGDYLLKIELPGYHPWEKRLRVGPGEAVFAEDLVLYPADKPKRLVEGRYERLLPSPNGRYLALLAADRIVFYNPANSRDRLATDSPGLIEPSAWSPDDGLIMVGRQVYDPANAALIGALPATGTVGRIAWHPGGRLIYRADDSALTIDDPTARQPSRTVLAGIDIASILINADRSYLLEAGESASRLKIYTTDFSRLDAQFELPYASDFELRPAQSGVLELYDRRFSTLFLLDPFATYGQVKDIIANVRDYRWLDGKNLLYSNGYEIWRYETDTKDRELLTRLSEPIVFIGWMRDKRHIVFATPTTLNVLELDARDRRNITTVFTAEKITAAVFSTRNDSVYLIARAEGWDGLHEIMLK